MKRIPLKKNTEDLRMSLGLYALVAFIAFFPCLILGQAYFDNDLLSQFGPWRAYLKDQLSQGHFPLWNPYSLGGQPFFADLQNMMLYPVNYLTLPFSVPYGLSVFFFLHIILAAAGMHLWLRALGLSTTACRIGALLFALSNFFWLELIHPPVLAAFAWLPWVFWALERLSQEPTPRRGFAAGLTFALLFLCGSFQVTLGALYGGGVYFLCRIRKNPVWKLFPPLEKGDEGGIRLFLICGLFFLWGSLPLLGQLIPTLEFSSLCDRLGTPLPYEQAIKGLSLHPKNLYQLVLPRFSLKEDQEMADAIQFHPEQEAGDAPFVGTLGYAGAWVPFLVFLAFRRKDRKVPLLLLGLAVASLAVSLGKFLPFHFLFWKILPGFSVIRVPYRFIFLWVPAASALAAFGYENWQASSWKKNEVSGILKAALAYSLVLYLAAFFHPLQDWREIAALGLGLVGMAWATLAPSGKTAGPRLLQIALLLPLLLNGWADFTPSPSSNFDYAKNSAPLPEITAKIKPFRLMFDNSHMGYPIEAEGKKYILNYPQNASCALGLKNIGGYNPLILQSKKDIAPLSMQPALQVNAMRGIISQKDQGDIPGFTKETYPPYILYVYQKPLSLVYAPSETRVIPDQAQLIGTLAKPDFDLSKTVLFSEPLPSNPLGPEGRAEDGMKYELLKDKADEQDYSITMNRNNWTVFTEVNYPGWKAWVDGQPAPILTADHLLRALYLTAGAHRVEFRFEPGWAKTIAWGLLLWLAATLGMFFFPTSSRLKNDLPL